MGLFDTVRCFAEVPGAELLGNEEFQTKDFGCRFEHFTINRQGLLVHHRPVYTSRVPFARPSSYRDVIVPIHRDARLFGPIDSSEGRSFCARFSDGVLQWVKPWEELSEVQREYAVTVES
jgi:hypothetical protein